MAGGWSKRWSGISQTFLPKGTGSNPDFDDVREEGNARYCPGGFHPVRLGEVYGSKYEVLRKLGFGQYSTVWLVRNRETRRFWAMKVLSAECYGSGSDIFELDILQHLQSKGSGHAGARHIAMLEDSFEHEGPNGKHMCLILKIMGESLSTFQKSFPSAQVPSPLVQRFAQQLLQAFECAHACRVIHTGMVCPSRLLINGAVAKLSNKSRHQAGQHHDPQPGRDCANTVFGGCFCGAKLGQACQRRIRDHSKSWFAAALSGQHPRFQFS